MGLPFGKVPEIDEALLVTPLLPAPEAPLQLQLAVTVLVGIGIVSMTRLSFGQSASSQFVPWSTTPESTNPDDLAVSVENPGTMLVAVKDCLVAFSIIFLSNMVVWLNEDLKLTIGAGWSRPEPCRLKVWWMKWLRVNIIFEYLSLVELLMLLRLNFNFYNTNYTFGGKNWCFFFDINQLQHSKGTLKGI